MSSLSRLLSSTVLLGFLFAVVSQAGAQTSGPPKLSFGSVAVGLTGSQVVSANLSQMNSTFSLAAGADYTISATTCVQDPSIGYDCTATVTFAPKDPGQHVDAVFAPNSDGVPTPAADLTGTGTSPQLGFFLGTAATYSPTVNNPVAVAVGPDGSFYTSSLGDNTVYQYSKNGGNRTTIDFSGFGNVTPGALAVDGSGTLYLADPVANRIYTHTLNSFGILADSTEVSDPVGLAVDANYSVYIADAGNRRVISIDINNTITVLASGLDNLVGVALDSTGNIYYAQAGSINTVFEIPAGGGTATTVGESTFGTIHGIAVDAGGAVYFATSAGLVLVSHNLTTAFGFGSGGPAGVAVDEQGNIYEAQVPVDGFSGSIAILLRNTGTTTLSAMVGQTDVEQVLIENTGNTPLSISGVDFSNSVFTITHPDGTGCSTDTLLPAGDICSIYVKFSPTAPQTYNGILTVTSNSLNRTATTNQYTLIGQTPTSTTTFIVSPNPSTAGQSVTFTASVSAYLGTSLTPTGTVDFLNVNNNNAILGSGTLTTVPSAGQQATFTSTTLPSGSYNVRARYNGSTTISGGISDPTTVVVNGLSATTTLAVSASTIAHGQPETLTATIATGGNPTISGTVEFLAGSNLLATVPVTVTSTGGTATYTTSTLGVGTQSLTAFYSGDTNYAAGSSIAQQVVVQGASPATISLAVSSTSVSYRSVIELTAAVLDFSGAPLTRGQVYFCDLSAPLCNASYNLGREQLNSGGLAVLHIAPGVIGSHQLVAIFTGTNTALNANSAPQTVNVVGTYPTSSTLTSSGTVGNYTLTGTVIGAGSRLPGPAGTATFQDLETTGTVTLGTSTLGTAAVGFTAALASGLPNAVGNSPYGIATGDFNGDGSADIVTGNYSAGTVSVLLGHGDGTFESASTYAVGTEPERILVADFNSDGIADLVVANTGSNSVSILLGVGDGTFHDQVTYAANSPVGLGVMDLNNDGIPDLAASDYYSNTMSVLLGNGDGTFQPAVTYATGNVPQTLAEGDLRNTGNVDIVVGNLNDNSVSVFLGNGDGTFQPQVTYAVGGKPQGVQVGDFNGDHFNDLAVSNSADGTISILLGNGDGTLKPQVTYPVGTDPVGLLTADFNGDGILDLATGNTDQTDLTESILLGNSDGTFQPQTKYKTGNFPYGEAAADFDGDGYPDLAISNYVNNTAVVLLSHVTATSTAVLSGVAVGAPTGMHNVDLSYPATGSFGASTSPTIQLTSGGLTVASSATTLSIAPAAATAGQAVAFTVAVAGTTQTAPVPTGTVTLASAGGTLGTTTITLGTTGAGSFATTQIPAGTYTVTATYSGDTNYAPSVSVPQTLVVTLATQTIAFPVIPNHATNDAPFTLAATASSNLPIAYTVISGPATVSGNTVTLTGASGTVIIRASQAGDTTYSAATSVTQSFTVSLATQTITFAAIPNHAVNDAPFTLAATASSNLAVSYAVVSGPATVSGSIVTLTGAVGTVVLRASQAGNTIYAAAASVTQSFTVSLATQTVTFPAIPSHTVEDAPFALTATASSNLAVSYAIVSGPATVSGNIVTLSGTVGTVVVQASQAGNTTYAAAASVTQSFAVSGAPTPTLTAITPSTITIGSAATTVTLTGTNFSVIDVLRLNGSATIATTFVNATTLTAVLPASALAATGTIQVTVNDLIGKTTSNALAITVSSTPAVVFTGPTAPPTSGQQPALTFQLTNPFPITLTGTVALRFAPTATASGADDPAVQFSSGGRTIPFTIPANSTVTPSVQLQTGTIAGTITVTLTLLDPSGANLTPASVAPVVIVIPPAPPVVNLVTMNASSGTVNVVITGFSNTREATLATFHFTAAPGAELNTPDFTANINPLFGAWYGSASSAPYGSTIVYTQSFTLDSGSANTITGVTVTLSNSIGTSNVAPSQ